MTPKKPKKRAAFPSRGGIPNARRRPADEAAIAGIVRALQRRRRAATEMGFSEREAGEFFDAIPLRGKHLRTPIHVRDYVPASRIRNNKPGMEFEGLVNEWDKPLARFHRTLASGDSLQRVALDRATHLLADTIRFFGNDYSKKMAQQFALNYLAGANITSPKAPREIAIEREQLRPFFQRFQHFIESRSERAEKMQSLRREARGLGYRLTKSRK